MKPRARFQRWWHCLTHLHRPETARSSDGRLLYIGCECGRHWFLAEGLSYLQFKRLFDKLIAPRLR